MTRRRRGLLALLALVVLLVGCGDDGQTSSTTTEAGAPTTEPALSGTITVSAAASLTESFEKIGADFEKAHPGTTVRFTFDSSKTLATQIVDGAKVDVYASADEKNTQTLVDAGLVDRSPTTFARNQLVIVTQPGNPQGIKTLADLAGVDVVALCGQDVPCGRFATQVLDSAGVAIDESKVTRGQNVKATLTAVTEGDAVAGIVYVTDAQSAGDAVEQVAIPDAQNAIATYPISVLAGTGAPELARAFVAFVASPEGERVLKEFGFLAPT